MIKICVYVWLVAVNLASFIVYSIDGKKPAKRMKEWLMLLLPALGGGLGGCLGNYCFNANYNHLNSRYWIILRYWSGFFLIIESGLLFYYFYGSINSISLSYLFHKKLNIFGYYLLGINAITAILQFIKTTESSWLPSLSTGVPLRLLVVLIILGGAPSALIVNFLFNYKYYSPTDCTKIPENIVYNIGIWILAPIWCIVIAFFIFGVMYSPKYIN